MRMTRTTSLILAAAVAWPIGVLAEDKSTREQATSPTGPTDASGAEVPVEVLRPVMTPFDRWGPFRRLNARLLTRAVTEALDARDLRDPVLVTTIPNAAGVVGAIVSQRRRRRDFVAARARVVEIIEARGEAQRR